MKCEKCQKELPTLGGKWTVRFPFFCHYLGCEVNLCTECNEHYEKALKVFEHEFLTDALDNKMTTLVTLSDGWGHVREAYYDKYRQLVFTECISVKELDSRFVNIDERKELSDSEVQDEDS